jgi:hypothetical protein
MRDNNTEKKYESGATRRGLATYTISSVERKESNAPGSIWVICLGKRHDINAGEIVDGGQHDLVAADI